METLLADVRYAVRSLRQRPAFTAVIVLTIAIGIGAIAMMMGVVNAAVIRPLPFRDADRLMLAQGLDTREHDVRGLSFLEARDWQARSRAFDALAIYDNISLNAGTAEGIDPQSVSAELVSANYFQVLGTNMARGRGFLPEDDRVPNARPVAVISHRLWTERFGASDTIVGGAMTLSGQRVTVVGVMPPGFRGLTFDADVWIPTMMVSLIRPVSILETRENRWLRVVGRVKANVSLADAQRDLDRVTAELAQDYPATNTDRGARVLGLRDYYLGNTRQLLFALLGAAAFLLLIVCGNVMSLQLARTASRRRELAVRVALGAARTRLVRQLLTEGIVLAAAGAGAGLILAMWGIAVLPTLGPAGLLPPYVEAPLDARVVAATALVTIAVGVLFGLAPVLLAWRTDLVTSLKDGAPATAAGLGSMRRLRPQQLLVISEVALALVLVTGATLMVRSFGNLLRVDPGFRPDGVIAARLVLPLDRYPAAERSRFADQLLSRLHNMPGASAAAISADLPLRGLESGAHLSYDGGTPEGVTYARHRVSPELFATLGIPLLRGRTFEPTDGANAPRVVVVSASTAERLWPGRNPIGQRIYPAGTDRSSSREVVGVVGDVRYRDLTTDLRAELSEADVYFPFAQATDETIEIALRGPADQQTLIAGLRAAVRDVDPTLPLFEVGTLDDALARQTAGARFGANMLVFLAGVALLLASLGVYGLLAFVVGACSRDIAIRMAMGAGAPSVVGLVLRRGLSLTLYGVALGLLLVGPSTRALSHWLVGVRPSDPITILGVTVLLGAASAVACWLPARRASLVDPQSVLKAD